jgi:hypothetical protein
MVGRVDKMRHAFTASAYGITKPYEEKYQAIAGWVEEHYADKVVLPSSLASALRNPKPENYYRDVNLVYAAVELLATHYYSSRVSEAERAQFHLRIYMDRLKELGLEDTRSLVGKLSSKAVIQGHTVSLGSDKIYLERHLGRGVSLNSHDALRLYYAWDAGRQRVVIGHMTSHLRNMATPKIT